MQDDSSCSFREQRNDRSKRSIKNAMKNYLMERFKANVRENRRLTIIQLSLIHDVVTGGIQRKNVVVCQKMSSNLKNGSSYSDLKMN